MATIRTRIEDEEADDADEERPKKRQAASFKFHRTVDPRGFLGAVIGKNGGTIKKLEKVTKTKMDVDQEAKTVEVKSDSARADGARVRAHRVDHRLVRTNQIGASGWQED